MTALPDAAAADTSVPATMAALAENFIGQLASSPGAQRLPPPQLPPHAPNLVWQNTLFASPHFRRAHVELFSAPGRFAVLHLCIFPPLNSAASIFGFDMIAGQDIATGIFIDFSPALPGNPKPDLANLPNAPPPGSLGTPRPRPAWGSIFSPAMIAVRPQTAADIARARHLAEAALHYYLQSAPQPQGETPIAHASQTKYILAQRSNEHTWRMLSRFTGGAMARAFIDETLFPLPPESLPLCA